MINLRSQPATAALLMLMLLLTCFGASPVMAFEEAAADAQPSHAEPPRTMNGLALTPPMGWNSWNKFSCNIDEALIHKMADAMVASGMKDAGYQYIVIDDCWHGVRDADGLIQRDSGIQNQYGST